MRNMNRTQYIHNLSKTLATKLRGASDTDPFNIVTIRAQKVLADVFFTNRITHEVINPEYVALYTSSVFLRTLVASKIFMIIQFKDKSIADPACKGLNALLSHHREPDAEACQALAEWMLDYTHPPRAWLQTQMENALAAINVHEPSLSAYVYLNRLSTLGCCVGLLAKLAELASDSNLAYDSQINALLSVCALGEVATHRLNTDKRVAQTHTLLKQMVQAFSSAAAYQTWLKPRRYDQIHSILSAHPYHWTDLQDASPFSFELAHMVIMVFSLYMVSSRVTKAKQRLKIIAVAGVLGASVTYSHADTSPRILAPHFAALHPPLSELLTSRSTSVQNTVLDQPELLTAVADAAFVLVASYSTAAYNLSMPHQLLNANIGAMMHQVLRPHPQTVFEEMRADLRPASPFWLPFFPKLHALIEKFQAWPRVARFLQQLEPSVLGMGKYLREGARPEEHAILAWLHEPDASGVNIAPIVKAFDARLARELGDKHGNPDAFPRDFVASFRVRNGNGPPMYRLGVDKESRRFGLAKVGPDGPLPHGTIRNASTEDKLLQFNEGVSRIPAWPPETQPTMAYGLPVVEPVVRAGYDVLKTAGDAVATVHSVVSNPLTTASHVWNWAMTPSTNPIIPYDSSAPLHPEDTDLPPQTPPRDEQRIHNHQTDDDDEEDGKEYETSYNETYDLGSSHKHTHAITPVEPDMRMIPIGPLGTTVFQKPYEGEPPLMPLHEQSAFRALYRRSYRNDTEPDDPRPIVMGHDETLHQAQAGRTDKMRTTHPAVLDALSHPSEFSSIKASIPSSGLWVATKASPSQVRTYLSEHKQRTARPQSQAPLDVSNQRRYNQSSVDAHRSQAPPDDVPPDPEKTDQSRYMWGAAAAAAAAAAATSSRRRKPPGFQLLESSHPLKKT